MLYSSCVILQTHNHVKLSQLIRETQVKNTTRYSYDNNGNDEDDNKTMVRKLPKVWSQDSMTDDKMQFF